MSIATEREPSPQPDYKLKDDGETILSVRSTWLRDHFYSASLIVLLISLGPRLFLTFAADPHDLVAPDSGTYFAPATNLLEHGAFLNGKQMPEVARTPGYPVFLSAIMVVTGKRLDDEDLRTVLVVQTIILSLSVVFLYWLARRILPPVMALVGALLAAFSPWGAVLAGHPLTEGLFVFLLALLLLLIKLVEDATTVKHAVWGSAVAGLLTAAIVLVRPVWPFLLFAAGTLLYRYGPRRRGAGLVLAFMIVSAASPVALWVVRNGQEAHFYGLSDISGKTAWSYLASRVIAQANGSDADRWAIAQAITNEETTWDLPLQEANEERWRRATAVFREHPWVTLFSFSQSVIGAHSASFFGDSSVAGKIEFPRRQLGSRWTLGRDVDSCVSWVAKGTR